MGPIARVSELSDSPCFWMALKLELQITLLDETVKIFYSDTFSIHGKNNFPLHKETGDLDIALPDDADDQLYLEALEGGLDRVVSSAAAQLVIYLAGADPFKKDRFGRMSLTKEGLERRDHLVFQHCYAAGLPVAVTMAGGYARQVLDTADIHFQTILTALEFQRRYRSV